MSAGTRSLVLRHFAALRRQGLGSDVALIRLVEGLPANAVREDCLRAVRALSSGVVVEDSTAFISVLCNPMGSPEQADCLAEAFEAQQDADDALRSPTTLLSLAVGGPLLLLMCIGWLLPQALVSTEVPSLTRLVLDLAELMRYLGLPLAVAVFWAVRALRKMFAPGFDTLSRAARVLAAATQPEKNVNFPVLNLTPVERQLLRVLAPRTHFSFAMRTLAAELLREGRASVTAFRVLAPVVAFFIMVQVYAGLLLALYLQVFHLAGSVQ